MLGLSKEKTRTILVWGIGIAVAIAGIINVFGAFLWLYYPFSPAMLIAYFVLTVLFPILYFKCKKRAYAIVSFVLFLVPFLMLGYIGIGIKVGWIQWL